MIHGLYAIADSGFGNPIEQAHSLLKGGVKTLQVRCKGWSPQKVAGILEQLQPDCRAAGCLLIVNDHPDLAHLADGVHLGQEDGPLHRPGLPRDCIVGRSTHDLVQVEEAIAEGFDYLGFGPVFGSHTKSTGYTERGLAALRDAVHTAGDIPVVAIGGISLENAGQVQSMGASAWAPISQLVGTRNVTDTARDFLSIS